MVNKAHDVALPSAGSESQDSPSAGQPTEPLLPGVAPACTNVQSTHSYACHKCGTEVTVGMWPYCPHGQYKQMSADFWYQDENFAPDGRTFRSLREVDKYAKDHNLEPRSSRGTRWY